MMLLTKQFALTTINGVLFCTPILIVTGLCTALAVTARQTALVGGYAASARVYGAATTVFGGAFAAGLIYLLTLLTIKRPPGRVVMGGSCALSTLGSVGVCAYWFNQRVDWTRKCIERKTIVGMLGSVEDYCNTQWSLERAPWAAQAFMYMEVIVAAAVLLGIPTYYCVVFSDKVGERRRMREVRKKTQAQAQANGNGNGNGLGALNGNGNGNGKAIGNGKVLNDGISKAVMNGKANGNGKALNGNGTAH